MNNEVIAYSPDELVGLLPLGRSACYRLAREIGVRVGHRIVVPRVALERWLGQQQGDKPAAADTMCPHCGTILPYNTPQAVYGGSDSSSARKPQEGAFPAKIEAFPEASGDPK